MRGNPISSEWMLLLFSFVLLSRVSATFYVSGFTPVYATGDPLYAKVGSLTSMDTLIPLSYYSLPYCKPHGGVRQSPMNLRELLMGDQMMNSPYRFRANVNESVFLCNTNPLTVHDVELLKKKIRDSYQVNMFLDTLPVRRYAYFTGGRILQWIGFPVGYSSFQNDGENYYVVNHLKFRVLIHQHELHGEGEPEGFEIIGFDMIPCSVKYDVERTSRNFMYGKISPLNCPRILEESQVIKEGERVSFTYQVEFVKTDLRWSSRWDRYLKTMDNPLVHSFSIINSVITMLFLVGVMAKILFRTKKERSGYRTLDSSEDKEAQPAKPTTGGILVPKLDSSNELFEGPRLKKLLCAMVGSGIQIMATTFVTVVVAALGFSSVASRGTLLTWIISFYLFLGILGGFVAVYLWKTITGTSDGWKSTSWCVASGFPGIALAIHSVLDLVLWYQNSTAAIPVFVYLEIFSMWLGILVPLTLLGGYIASQTKQTKCLTSGEWVPKKAGARKSLVWLLAFGAGGLPFATIFIELFFIFSSLFLGRYYTYYGFLLIVVLLLIIICSITSLIVAYMSLRAENSGWWWKAFWASGSVAVYLLIYCINYLFGDLRGLNGLPSVVLYLGFSAILVVLTMLAAGSVGFLGSFFLINLLSYSFSGIIS